MRLGRLCSLRLSSCLGPILFFTLLSLAACQSADDSGSKIMRDISNEARKAYDLFSIVLSGADEDSAAFENDSQVVFRDGQVMNQWIPVASEGNTTVEPMHLFHHDEYSDRISFDMFYGPFDTYDYSQPYAISSDAKAAKPKIVEYQSDLGERAGSFTLIYDCTLQTEGDAKSRSVVISVFVPVVSGVSALFSIRKSCGGGQHPHLIFGHYEESDNGAVELSRVPFKHDKMLFVGPHVISTRLFLDLQRPARTQEFFHVTAATTDQDQLTLNTRGPTFGGVLKVGEPTIIHVLYDCRGRGKQNVTVHISLTPFNALHQTWTKDCGGGYADGIGVGSESYRTTDVLVRGRTTPLWSIPVEEGFKDVHGDTNSTEATLPVVGTSISNKNFFFVNKGFPVLIGQPAITVEHPGVVSAFFPNPSSHGSEMYIPAGGGILGEDSKLRLNVRLICKRKGRSRVLITVPIKSFTNVEFGFVKACHAPRKRVHSSFLRTANSVMTIVSFFILGAFSYWWRLRGASISHHAAKKTTDGLLVV